MNLKRDSNKKVISIIGTTGVGKSQLSIELAKKFNGEIINADSMQMYIGLDNITNKHPVIERDGIAHHVMNHIPWNEMYYIHKFKKECETVMNDCWNRGKIPILVGGTHYYLQSVLFENKTIGSNNEIKIQNNKINENNENENNENENNLTNLTNEQREILESNDWNLIFNKLKEVDPVISNKFHPKDIRRVKRALEVYYINGIKASSLYENQREKINENGTSLKYDTLFFWIYSKLPELDKRLDLRVNKMMINGGINELIELYDFYQNEINNGNKEIIKMDNGVWQVIGFKEFLSMLNEKNSYNKLKNIKDNYLEINKMIENDKEFNKCSNEMKIKTRRYARKQIKWIKNLLLPELKDEENNGFVKFGKIFVLDATDLNKWNENVGIRGAKITEEFLKMGYVNDDNIKDIPESLKDEKLNGNNNGVIKQWVHHECDVCTDRETGKPLIYVEEQWQIHLKSKKHKFNLNRGKKKKEYQEWLKANKVAK